MTRLGKKPLCATLALAISTSLPHAALAQSLLRGHLQTTEEHPLYDVLALRDSVVVAGNSFTTPEFKLALPDTGRYTLVLSGAQFETLTQKVTVAGDTTNLGTILLQTNTIKGAVVSAAKPTFQYEGAGNLKVNVEGSPLASHGDALTVLGRIPGLRTDPKNGSISLLERGSATFFVNGQRVYDLAMLQSIPAQDIQSVTVDKSPSATYAADTEAGIHIQTKTRAADHLLVTVGNTAYMGKRFSDQLDISVSHKAGKVSQQLSVSPGYVREVADQTLRITAYDDAGNAMQSSATALHEEGSRAGKMDALYVFRHEMDERNGYGLQYTLRHEPERDQLHTTESRDALTNAYASDISEWSQTHNVGVDYTHRFDPKQRLGLQADVAFHLSRCKQDIQSAQWESVASTNHYTIFGGNADYTLERDGFSLQCGLSTSWVRENGDNTYNASTRQNHIQEEIHAIYASARKTLLGMDFSLGVRGEYARTTIDEGQGNDTTLRRKFRLFPTLSVEKTFGKDGALSLSVSRNIRRPSYEMLTPEFHIADGALYTQGNPSLQPTLATTAKLSGRYKGLSTILRYRDETNPYVNLIEWAPNPTIQRNLRWISQNVPRHRELTAGAECTFTLRKCEGTASVCFHQPFLTATVLGKPMQFNHPTLQIGFSLQCHLCEWATLGLDYRFDSQSNWYIHTNAAEHYGNVQVAGDLCKGKIQYALGMDNVFNATFGNIWTCLYGNVRTDIVSNYHGRTGYFSIKFHFGKAKVNVERRSANQEALGRL